MQGMLQKSDMQQATREKRKTVTRRLDHLKEINQEPSKWKLYPLEDTQKRSFAFFDGRKYEESHEPLIHIRPRYHVDEVVYIKEAWAITHNISGCPKLDDLVTVNYLNGEVTKRWGDISHNQQGVWLHSVSKAFTNHLWQSPMFLPECLARTFTQITDVRPELFILANMTPEELAKEGGEEALKYLKEYYDGKWVFRYEYVLLEAK